jgi:hypothetical protein
VTFRTLNESCARQGNAATIALSATSSDWQMRDVAHERVTPGLE